jgi:hypothetical protein
MLSTIPFSGFYYSIHDQEIDHTLESMFSDRNTGCEVYHGLVEQVYRNCDFSAVYLEYAKEYAENFGQEFEIKSLKFESMQSPKEYNFTTDRIFVEIDFSEVERIYQDCDKAELAKLVKEKFTSRDGFISFYSNCLESWGNLETWDYNQVGTLLECMAGRDFDIWKEYAIMENAIGNGYIIGWIEENTKDIARIYRVYDYLENRKERKTA